MKIIFLDVDGVLSSFGERGLCATRLDMFAAVVKTTGAEVVLSSTWRYPLCRDQCRRLQQELGKRGVEFIGFTPILDVPIGQAGLFQGWKRGDEIQTWLNEHRRGPEAVENFVILDDDPNDEMGSLKTNLVKTDGWSGLTSIQTEEIIRRLGRVEALTVAAA